jgi:hypothetical protein
MIGINVLSERAEAGNALPIIDGSLADRPSHGVTPAAIGSRIDGPRSHSPPAMEPTQRASRRSADDPRLYLLETGAQAHRSASPGLLTSVGCEGCTTLGVHGMSEARLDHSQ